MASFAQTLKSFNTGSLSRDDLYETLDRILTDERADTPWLLKILEQEQAQAPLPQEVYDAVKDKIKEATDYKMDKTNAQSEPTKGEASRYIDEDVSRTQLATGFFQSIKSEIDDSVAQDRPATPSPKDPRTELPIKGIGDVLNGRFVLEERLGSGGMSTVYRALDRRKLEANDRDPYIAVKILSVEFRAHPDSLVALQREAKKCHRLAHPNIVRAYDFDRDGSTVYMTMEYLSGHSLAKTLRDPAFKGMSCEQAMPIIKGMADALAFAHKNGIVHADFKPANVILTDGGEIKVIDFGIARAFQKPGEGDMEATRFDPGSLGALTPTYASPEMLEHREPDPRDDVYALACIVYEMLSGRHPFGRRQADEARDGGLTLERKTLSRRQWKALKSALAFDRDKRTPSVELFLRAIDPECSSSPKRALAASVALALLLTGAGMVNYYAPSIGLFSPFSKGGDGALPHGSMTETTVTPSDHDTGKTLTSAQGQAGQAAAKAEEAVVSGVEPAITAALVGGTDDIDPTPESVPAPEETLDAVKAQLNAYDCAALSASIDDDRIRVAGYLSESTPVAEMTDRLRALPGVAAVDADIDSLTDPMCEVVALYRKYWLSNRQNRFGTAIKPGNGSGKFVAGDPLVVELQTPAFDSYVNIDYYSLDGHVVHMVPSPRIQANQAPANYTATLGDLNQWIVSAPYGKELVVILTTPVSLFEELREEHEKASVYLGDLKKRLASLDTDEVQRNIAADFVLIHTRPE